jgi:hypothetical protein
MSRAASKEEGQRLEQQKRQPTGLALTRRRLLGVMVGMGLVASSRPALAHAGGNAPIQLLGRRDAFRLAEGFAKITDQRVRNALVRSWSASRSGERGLGENVEVGCPTLKLMSLVRR